MASIYLCTWASFGVSTPHHPRPRLLCCVSERCGNNYGWSRFEGSRCQEAQQDRDGPCAGADRSGFTFPLFEYCHPDFDSEAEDQQDFTAGVDICGSGMLTGSAVIGAYRVVDVFVVVVVALVVVVVGVGVVLKRPWRRVRVRVRWCDKVRFLFGMRCCCCCCFCFFLSSGGYVYRGTYFNDLIGGAYVFGDQTNNNVYYIREEGGTWTVGTIISDGSVDIIAFAEDNDVREGVERQGRGRRMLYYV